MISRYIGGFFRTIGSITKISEYGLWRYVFLTSILGLTIGGGIVLGAYTYAGALGTWFVDVYPFEWGRASVQQAAGYIGGGLVGVVGLVLLKYLVLGLSSPIMSFVSERVEYKMTGIKFDVFSIGRFIKELVRGIMLSLRNIIKEILFLTLLFILGLILPFLAPLIAVLSFLVQAYYAGFASLDYFMERRFSIRKSKETVKEHRWAVMGIGSGFLVILLFPIVGWVFAPVLSTIAATEYAVKNDIDNLEIEEGYV